MHSTGAGLVQSAGSHERPASMVPCEASSPEWPLLAVCFVCSEYTSVVGRELSTIDEFRELCRQPLALSLVLRSWLIQLRAGFTYQLLRLGNNGSSISIDFALSHNSALHEPAKHGPSFAFSPSCGDSTECSGD